MVRKAIILGAALLIGGPAAAQTTTCLRNGVLITCNTSPGIGRSLTPPDYSAMMNTPDLGESSEKSFREARARQAADNAEQLRRNVGGLVAAGDCDGASRLALKAGNFDLAERAAQLCVRK
jgi:hypothetical protein